MKDEFNIANGCGKSRPPTIVRIEVNMCERKITAVWKFLQATKEIPFPMDHLFEDDVWDVFTVAQTAIKVIEKEDPPLRFVGGDTVEVWAVLNDSERMLLATAAVSVTSLLCRDCEEEERRLAN